MSDRLTTELAGLSEGAPPAVLPAVLLRTGLADGYVRRRGPIGPVFVAFGDRGVSLVDLAGDPARFEAAARARLGRPVLPADPPPALAAAVDRAITSGRPGRLGLDLGRLSDFQTAVLHKAAEIPRGEVRSYGWVAAEIGRPGAVRAVGSALAGNPIPLIVPCHRVVRSDGTLGRYSLGGAANKPRLLEAEGVDVEGLRKLSRRGVRYLGSATTGIFCHPTCRHARRITDRHRVEFATVRDAESRGFRPCRDCRPHAA
jgi:O-6-methylguanine DNA methyltransferase